MKILVCGGRNYNNKILFNKILNFFKPTTIIQGGASGADKLAFEYAINNNIKIITYNAEWDKYGKSAGPIRNKKMLLESNPDIVMAFPGGKGTKNMVNISKFNNFSVIEINE